MASVKWGERQYLLYQCPVKLHVAGHWHRDLFMSPDNGQRQRADKNDRLQQVCPVCQIGQILWIAGINGNKRSMPKREDKKNIWEEENLWRFTKQQALVHNI